MKAAVNHTIVDVESLNFQHWCMEKMSATACGGVTLWLGRRAFFIGAYCYTIVRRLISRLMEYSVLSKDLFNLQVCETDNAAAYGIALPLQMAISLQPLGNIEVSQ